MGLNTRCLEQIKLEQRFMTHKIVELDNMKIGIEVQ